MALASNSGVLSTIQHAAQHVLHNGWSLLLPTAEERAHALSALLPVPGKGRVKENRYIGLCCTKVSAPKNHIYYFVVLDVLFGHQVKKMRQLNVNSSSQ